MSEGQQQQTDQQRQVAVRRQFLTTLNDKLQELEPKLGQLLPRYLPARRFFLIAYDSVTRTPALQECTIPSILKSVIEAAELRLEVGGPRKHAWLVPFRNRHSGKMEAQLIPGYMGLAHLAYDAGGVTKIEPHKVYARDEYVPQGGPDSPSVHVPFNEYCTACNGAAEVTVTTGKGKDAKKEVKVCGRCEGTGRESRGRVIAYYTVATLTNGLTTECHMTRADVEKIRQRSKAKDAGPWVTDFDEMGIKTCFKRHEKFLPKTDGEGSARLAKAIELDNAALGIDENAGAVETTGRAPLPSELLDDDETPATAEEHPDTTASAPQKAAGDSATVTQAPAAAAKQETKADAEKPEEKKTEETKPEAVDEFINPQRRGLLKQTAFAAGLDEMRLAEFLKEFNVPDLEHVKDSQFSDVLGKLAKLPPAKKKSK